MATFSAVLLSYAGLAAIFYLPPEGFNDVYKLILCILFISVATAFGSYFRTYNDSEDYVYVLFNVTVAMASLIMFHSGYISWEVAAGRLGGIVLGSVMALFSVRFVLTVRASEQVRIELAKYFCRVEVFLGHLLDIYEGKIDENDGAGVMQGAAELAYSQANDCIQLHAKTKSLHSSALEEGNRSHLTGSFYPSCEYADTLKSSRRLYYNASGLFYAFSRDLAKMYYISAHSHLIRMLSECFSNILQACELSLEAPVSLRAMTTAFDKCEDERELVSEILNTIEGRHNRYRNTAWARAFQLNTSPFSHGEMESFSHFLLTCKMIAIDLGDVVEKISSIEDVCGLEQERAD